MLLRSSVVLLLLAAGPWLSASAAAQSARPDEPVIVVSGEGVVKAAPDRAWITIGAESRSKDPKEAQALNAKAMSAVQAKLSSLGFAGDALRTVGYDLQLEFDYVDGRQVPRGYVARNSIEVRVDDIARVGEVLDASVGTGATSVHGLRFDLQKRDALEREALKLAVADARARAEAIAAGAGSALGRILRIEESGARPAPPQPVMMRMAAEDARASTPVAPGQIEIRAQVTLSVSLK